MRNFIVSIVNTEIWTADIEVEAENEREAECIARSKARDGDVPFELNRIEDREVFVEEKS